MYLELMKETKKKKTKIIKKCSDSFVFGRSKKKRKVFRCETDEASVVIGARVGANPELTNGGKYYTLKNKTLIMNNNSINSTIYLCF